MLAEKAGECETADAVPCDGCLTQRPRRTTRLSGGFVRGRPAVAIMQRSVGSDGFTDTER
ncbi:hypothetical protein BA059_05030 [Mycolicibacterium sp. (ex Dasyatis americana)]|nr:hypothetical protein BA059_05030 [Mycolicibacterium sp. (ex Dasyatis americana)]